MRIKRPQFLDNIASAHQSIRMSRLRSFLTMLGITIGVACVTCILSLSGGVGQLFTKQVESIKGNLIVIRPSLPSQSLESMLNSQPFATSSLTDADVTSIEKLDNVISISQVVRLHSALATNDTSVIPSAIIGTTPDFIKTSNIAVKEGQFFDKTLDENSAVIGHDLAVQLFGTDTPLGSRFHVKDQSYIVVGILKKQPEVINFNKIDYNMSAIVPIKRAKKLANAPQIQQINVLVTTNKEIDATKQSITALLQKAHKSDSDAVVLSGSEITQPTTKQFTELASVMLAIATVSIVVGGIGIMNSMLVNVSHRTREIGLRKAVGASNRAIIYQFLTESTLMSFTGGTFGVIIGYGLSSLIGAIINFSPHISLLSAGAGILLSIATGILFGLYPALRAGLKNPIESLRQYH